MVVLADVPLRQEPHCKSRFAHPRRADDSYFDLGERRLLAPNSPDSRARAHLAVSGMSHRGKISPCWFFQPSLKPESQSLSTSATTSLPRFSFLRRSSAMCSSTTRWHSSRSATSVAAIGGTHSAGRESSPDHRCCVSSRSVKNRKPMPELVSLGRSSVEMAGSGRLRARAEATRHCIGTAENFGKLRIPHAKVLDWSR